MRRANRLTDDTVTGEPPFSPSHRSHTLCTARKSVVSRLRSRGCDGGGDQRCSLDGTHLLGTLQQHPEPPPLRPAAFRCALNRDLTLGLDSSGLHELHQSLCRSRAVDCPVQQGCVGLLRGSVEERLASRSSPAGSSAKS